MLQSDLVLRIRNYFENDTYYASGDINASIQDAYDETVGLSGVIFKSASVPFVNNLSYYDMLDYIPDLLSIVCIYNNVQKKWMCPSSLLKFELDNTNWETSTGVPDFFCVVSYRYMALYRKPIVDNYGNMTVYYKAAAPLINATDTFLIQDEHMNALESYVRADLFEQQQEWSKASKAYKDYVQDLEQLVSSVKHQKNVDRVMGLK